MMTAKLLRAALFAAPAALLFAAPAQAQVTSIATASPEQVVLQSKAYKAAMDQISKEYASDFQAIQKRQEEVSKQLQPIQAKWDKNGDKQVDDQELQAAQTSDKANFDKWQSTAAALSDEVRKLRTPSLRAELFALENILANYSKAIDTVTKARKIGAILSPDVFQWSDPAADIGPLLLTEMDKTATVPTTVPASWPGPRRSTVAFQQQLNEVLQNAMAAQAAQQQAQGAQPGAQGQPAQPGKPNQPKPQPQQPNPSR